MNKKQLIELIREIVSTEVEKFSGGAPEVQKSQSGFGYLGKQSDAPKQERKNEKHIYFNTVTSGEAEAGGEGETENSTEQNPEA
jgi:hypothetical protein